jgi:hypothetical protein
LTTSPGTILRGPVGVEVLLAKAHDVEALLFGANGFVEDLAVPFW